MSRDYKHRVTQKRKRNTLSPLVGVIAGLLIGLFVAFLVYIKMQSEPREPVYVQETLPPATAPASQENAQDASKNETEVTPPPPKPRFDFYTLLPEMEVVIPEEEITESRKQPAPTPVEKPAEPAPARETTPVQPAVSEARPVDTPAAAPAPVTVPAGAYYLQVGSFRNAEQAERFKAELAMLGLQTSIQQVTINNTDTYHRVRVGPFGTLNELDRIRQKLKQKGIDSTPIKVRG